MVTCKHCQEQVMVHNLLDMDIYLYRHLKMRHPSVFKKEENKILEDMFADNFTVDNPESDISERYARAI